MTTPASRPLITANQVTAARLVPMPLIAWLIYQGETGWWIALVLALVVGSTDYLDGHLARKQGPTSLGALLDPLADKVFLAFMYVPLCDLGFLPVWPIAVMFMREFLVTAMRSAYAQRGIHFETSYLAKAKTWIQMQASGTLMLCGLLGRTGALALLSGVFATAVLVLLLMRLLRGRFYKNLVVAVVFCALPVALYLAADAIGDARVFFHGACWILAALTWVSGLDYLVGGLPRLRAAGGFGRADAVRVVAAGALPILALLLVIETAAPAWAVLALFAFELALGGLDNMLSLHGRAAPALPWGLRALGAALLLAVGLALPGQAVIAATAAAVVSALGAASEFWRGRDVYLA
ncbi:MAG TPA: CDP-alcohol phosphatidyltransferase family protein [Kofleriaceae bacterium]|nr:CDP-alcohol phosphatidyltransferase family protein [Kofleriaceae bacterium]